MFGSFSASCLQKRLASCGFAVALAAGLSVAPAGASSLADYYRTMFTMKFCNISADTENGEENSEVDVEQEIRLPVDQEFIDADATSEDVAPIFEQLNAEYNADPAQFCEQNAATAQEVVEENQ
jgi:hypothetical protein